MCDKYDSFLHRMTKYRKNLDLTQVEISNELGITQSQLSKMEQGKTIYSYKTLQALYAMKWDVDYFITGKKYEYAVSELSFMLADVKDKALMQLVAWALIQGIKKSTVQVNEETELEIELLMHRAYTTESHSLLYEIRTVSEISQIPMSEKLGVNIKKYRMLERNEISPDAELLMRIYEETGCRPSLFLNPDCVDEMIISNLWQLIDPKVQKEILLLVRQGESVLNS